MSPAGARVLPAGSYPVMLTPFDDRRRIDVAALERLVDWYVEAGSAGLFTNSRSSEFEYLSAAERLELARHVVRAAAGRVPVVSTGTTGVSVQADAEFIAEMADTGVDAVVVITNHLAPFGAPDEVVQQNLATLLDLTGSIDLGFYECPTPWKRLLTDATYAQAAQSGRFVFHKDTSHDLDVLRRRAGLGAGTRMRLYNAQTSSILAGLAVGTDGHSGIAANLFPDLVARLCSPDGEDAADLAVLQSIVAVAEGLIGDRYPTSAKQLVNHSDGLDLELVSRMDGAGPRDAHGFAPLRAVVDLAAPHRRPRVVNVADLDHAGATG